MWFDTVIRPRVRLCGSRRDSRIERKAGRLCTSVLEKMLRKAFEMSPLASMMRAEEVRYGRDSVGEEDGGMIEESGGGGRRWWDIGAMAMAREAGYRVNISGCG